MWKLNDIKKIKYLGPYAYLIEFDDGVKGKVDLSFILVKGPIFKPLNNVKLFRSARIEGGTISWPNGADLAPETLYEAIQGRSTTYSSKRVPRRRAAELVR